MMIDKTMKWSTAEPKEAGWYLVTMIDHITNTPFVMPMERCEYPPGHWYWDGRGCIIGSIKFPEPMRTERIN